MAAIGGVPGCFHRFCEARLNPEAVNGFIQALPTGITGNIATLNEKLAAVDYCSALPYVWAERDRPARLAWLREKAGEYHVPLLYELGMAELAASFETAAADKVKEAVATINKVTLPLFQLASLRAHQDLACADKCSPTFADRAHELGPLYTQAMKNLFEKKAGRPLKMGVDTDPHVVKNTALEKLKELLEHTKESKALPHPRWITCPCEGEVILFPEASWQERRRVSAEESLKEASETILP